MVRGGMLTCVRVARMVLRAVLGWVVPWTVEGCPALGHTVASSLVRRPSEAPSWGPLANCNLSIERLAGVFSDSVPLCRGCLVLERVGGVVPRLTTIDLETAAHLRIAVDADDLVALRALPPLETVGRALERHARAALVAHLALQGGGAGATCVAREVSAHVVVSLLLPVSAGPHHQHGPTHAILHPSLAKFRMPISYPLVPRVGLTGRVGTSTGPGTPGCPANKHCNQRFCALVEHGGLGCPSLGCIHGWAEQGRWARAGRAVGWPVADRRGGRSRPRPRRGRAQRRRTQAHDRVARGRRAPRDRGKARLWGVDRVRPARQHPDRALRPA